MAALLAVLNELWYVIELALCVNCQFFLGKASLCEMPSVDVLCLKWKNDTLCSFCMRQYGIIYRIFQDPKKQLKRCFWIVATLPKLYLEEVKRKRSIKGNL